ncbi:MAG: glycoside hydrolase family 3 protein [Clostridiales bacterium]|nr:glycoside hydrolase family 3 protein [Clostridiales bacterium]
MDREKAKAAAERLVKQMTVEEMASQLRYDAPAIPRLGIPEYNWWNEALHGVANAGTATVFPQAVSLAAVFDADEISGIADIIATEGRAKYNAISQLDDRDIFKGLTYWSPNINIFRDPRWGRGQETYGEDPYLTSRLGVAFVRGLQGNGKYLKAAACAKHFAVHSGPETLRHEFNAEVSPKDLRETYLPAFEALVREAGVEAVMGAYNRVNGEPACGSKTLMEDILRGEWGFEGHFVSDCWAIRDFHEHHKVTSTAPESAALALRHGCDLNCGNTYLQLLIALKEGLIDEGMLRNATVRLFTTRCLLGLFDDSCELHFISPLESDSDTHAARALRIARKSMVLLKNDGVLPLRLENIRTVAVIGPVADSHAVLEGNYNGTSSRYTTFLEGIRHALAGRARVLYAEGAKLNQDRGSVLSKYANDRLQEAVAAAQAADVTLLCVGLDGTLEGEEGERGNTYFSGDREDILLPPSQRLLAEAMRQHAKKLVTVITSGSALDVREGNAILWAGYPGQAGGTALADLLLGVVSPSGKLPVTFYRSEDTLPEFTDYSMKNRTYRYHEAQALYPFGYGLSYAVFSYRDARFEQGHVSVSVCNDKGPDAEEVVQVYVKAQSPFAPLNPRLAGFKRVALRAGEEQQAMVPIDPDMFTVINEEGFREQTSATILFVGGSQPDTRSAELLGSSPLRLEVSRQLP